MNIHIKKLQKADETALYEFELSNRSFFEEMVPSRGDEYYKFPHFQRFLTSLIEEQIKEESFFYLIKDEENSIIGRVNLIDINKGIGHIGYRVGKNFIGKGAAYNAVKLLLEEIMKKRAIKEIHAKTTTNNIASQKVLEKNGFQNLGQSEEIYTAENGEQFNFIHFVWRKTQ
ncbi:GNAT family N-acetyltransferase [Cytobacillus purgationiresistens]|uniref:Ribosomal-protein-alanine N-acetyltransferase n=1 Tax=Cytobacillus purgationiresistens TaxID=863449 RepID=A0ABU0ARC7_9BACI|nr:GNAT family N-acetyltransferase [Cytobacillus purgationiresistens]MDQ0273819.1 ribosomal-protein-alanine N-acetyltransferase [Cytobacillus purgationiresistens]